MKFPRAAKHVCRWDRSNLPPPAWLRVGTDSGPFIGEGNNEINPQKVEEGWLIVTPLQESLQFNPKSVGYLIRKSAQGVEISFRNFSDRVLFFDFAIAGYQDENTGINARVALQVGQIVVMPVALPKVDPRIAVAKVKVFNIRSGADNGPLLSERVR